MNKTLIYAGLIAFVVSATTISFFQYLAKQDANTVRIEHVDATPSKSALYSLNEQGAMVPLDFSGTAEKVVHAVVHIQSTQTSTRRSSRNREEQIPAPFRDFFEDFMNPRGEGGRGLQPQPRVGTGSGVIINENGYIVTNNHVIDNASDIEVTLKDNRTYKATVIGTDPTTDLALIQIDENNLPTIPMVNSDEVRVGEWVMAIGNPLGLNSTVTAGIVSAKGRNINILRERFAIESFIQTDAAINPGNSGGALVNLNGGLVGINTAIASPTGSYSGYGFAVPANIVNKVVEDLLEFGTVQRGVLGIMIRDVSANLAKEKDLALNKGIFVDSLLNNSAAGEAGIRPGDVILKVDDNQVNRTPELQEMIARKRPGDVVTIAVDRSGKEKIFAVTLNSPSGRKAVAKQEFRDLNELLGAELESLSRNQANELDLDGGVKVAKIFPGKLSRSTNMKAGFIITHADGRKVRNVEELSRILENKNGGVMVEGVYEDSPEEVLYFGFGV